MYIVVQIKALDIDITGEEISIMRFKHTNKIYPPRVKMTVAMINPETLLKLPVRFVGCSSDSQLDMELIFPLVTPFSSLPTLSRNPGWQQEIHICELKYIH